ncbi:MAG: cell division protein SepF [Clostridia bacterium]|nr:cell division protein SepF [Clostridia bacterium]
MAGFMGKFKNMLKQPDEDMEEYEDDYTEYDEVEQAEPEEAPAEEESYDEGPVQQQAAANNSSSNDNVINIHDTSKVNFVLFKPENFDKDITSMADEFIKRSTIILNMEQTNKDVAKRIIDFLSGVAYAHNGKISRISEDTYIVMPSNVKLSGDDVMDEVESDNIYF